MDPGLMRMGKTATSLRLNIRSGSNTESEIVGVVGEKLQAPRDTVFTKSYLSKINLKLPGKVSP